jgi:hypothetical protein
MLVGGMWFWVRYKCLDHDAGVMVNPTLCAQDACFLPRRRGELGAPLWTLLYRCGWCRGRRDKLPSVSRELLLPRTSDNYYAESLAKGSIGATLYKQRNYAKHRPMVVGAQLNPASLPEKNTRRRYERWASWKKLQRLCRTAREFAYGLTIMSIWVYTAPFLCVKYMQMYVEGPSQLHLLTIQKVTRFGASLSCYHQTLCIECV